MILLLLGSCNVENKEDFLLQTVDLELRSQEIVKFDNVQILGCCIIVEVRTNVFSSDPCYPWHQIAIVDEYDEVVEMFYSPPCEEWYIDENEEEEYRYYWYITHCFKESGEYCLQEGGGIIGIDNPNNPNNPAFLGTVIPHCFEIDAECNIGCTYYLCWEEMVAYCVKEITKILFKDRFGVYGEKEFDPPINIFTHPGDRFLAIRDAALIALDEIQEESFGGGAWTGSFSDSHPGVLCLKGGIDPTPGWFFTDSDFEIIRFEFNSLDGCPNPEDVGTTNNPMPFHSIDCN